MFNMKLLEPLGGDCSSYEIILNKKYSVREFINIILKEKPDEWGYFGIYNKGCIFGSPHCEYRYGDIINIPLTDDFLEMEIKKVTARGGWSRMDYVFYI